MNKQKKHNGLIPSETFWMQKASTESIHLSFYRTNSHRTRRSKRQTPPIPTFVSTLKSDKQNIRTQGMKANRKKVGGKRGKGRRISTITCYLFADWVGGKFQEKGRHSTSHRAH